MRITFVTRKFGNVERNSHCDVLYITPIRVVRLFLDCNGDFAIKAYNSNFTAATCRDAVFHTIPTPTVCYSVPSIVEVSGGCQSVNIICLRQRGITIVK